MNAVGLELATPEGSSGARRQRATAGPSASRTVMGRVPLVWHVPPHGTESLTAVEQGALLHTRHHPIKSTESQLATESKVTEQVFYNSGRDRTIRHRTFFVLLDTYAVIVRRAATDGGILMLTFDDRVQPKITLLFHERTAQMRFSCNLGSPKASADTWTGY